MSAKTLGQRQEGAGQVCETAGRPLWLRRVTMRKGQEMRSEGQAGARAQRPVAMVKQLGFYTEPVGKQPKGAEQMHNRI